MPATVPRFVLCPKCRSLLPEPPAGNPLYRCGKCSTTLQAKHATRGEVEATNRRISAAEQRNRNSYSDSSSGEIGSEAVLDEFALTGYGNKSPLYSQKKQSAKEVVLENGSRGMDARGVTKPHRERSQDRLSDPYPQAARTQEQEDVMMSGADEYTPPESAHQEIGSREHWSASPDAISYGMSETRSRTDVTTTLAASKTMSSVGHSHGSEAIAAADDDFRTSNGNSLADELKQLQLPHVQPDFARGSVPSDSVHNHHHLHDLGSQRIHEPSANNASQPPITAAGENIVSGPPSRKLRWKVREFDSGDEATSSGAASSKGISEDDDGGSSQEDMKSTASVKETTSVEYNKKERTWRTVQSRRHSYKSLDERQGATVQQQQQHLGSPSEDPDRTIDMYENSAHVLDYEPSDTSSTTMDEVESNGGGGGSGQFSGEMDRHPHVVEQGSSTARAAPRPHLLPRSTTNSSRGSALSEESSSYGSPSQIETVSPDNHIDNARLTAAARRHSWDERVTRMPPAAPSYAGGPQPGPSAVRHKSSSHDFGSAQTDHLHRMSSVSSDPGGRLSSSKGRQSPASLSDNYRPASSYGPRSFPQQQWVNRFMPPSSPMMQQPWSPNSSSQRSFFPEPSPLHPLYSKLPTSARSVSGGQLPPKPGHYPLLPPPGALPHVLCQHCGLLLAVPENLPPNPKNTQKLRCGSCRKISIFSVPQAEGSDAVQGFGSSRSDSLQSQTLLASSPDSQSEFQSTYRTVSSSLRAGERRPGGRRYSVSDLAEKQVQEHLVRKLSLGNEDSPRADHQDVVERSLSERVEALAIHSSASSPSSSVPSSSFRAPSDHKSDQPGECFSNELPYRRPGGGSPYPRFNNIPQNGNVGDSPSSEDKVSAGVAMSDSEIDGRSLSSSSSPQLNNQTNSGSATALLSHATMQDPRSSEAPNEQGHHEVRGLRTLKEMLFRKGKHGGVAQYRRKVVVNGVAIPDHLVKKAEDQAGPIHPGTYWYDGKAGFWGVAGGPCRGIIPPFIEEFNYPMTRDCAAGRTGIFVNCRELHHLDRDKLCRRGLPDSPGMAYHIEIDGRVVEEATGSELRSLGRLAPSLEKSGRGAGMHSPSNSSGGGRS